MRLATSNTVVVRDNMGRFIDQIRAGGERTIDEALERGASLSRAFAPVGAKMDSRTTKLKDSIYTVKLSSTSGYWASNARHALPQETGSKRHPITGNPALGFYWEKAGRNWIPAESFYGIPGLIDYVDHPGNPAQPFLRPAYEIVMKELPEIMRKNFRG
jgi:hypothetical protein